MHWDLVQTLNKVIGLDITSTIKVYTNEFISNGEWVKEIKERNLANKEGYVLRFHPSNFRMKIKFEEYVRLHSLMTQFSNVDIWKCLSSGTPIDLDNVPDEFDEWVQATIKTLEEKYNEIDVRAGAVFADIYLSFNQEFPPKAEFAKYISQEYPKYMHSILFRMYDGREYDSIIWKLIRPTYEKPFWQKQTEEV